MKIKICKGKGCSDRFSDYMIERLQNDKKRFNLNKLEFEESLCMGECKKGPNVMVDKNIHNYMTPVKVSELAMGRSKKSKKNKNNKNNKK